MKPLIGPFEVPIFRIPMPDFMPMDELAIHGFGILVAIGFLLGGQVAMKAAERRGLDPEVITAEEVIEMATLSGAKATGWEDEIGALEPGKKADMILIDIDRPEWVPSYNLVYSLVYAASGDSVDTVIVDGNVLMENRELTTMDLSEVHARCREAAPKLVERANVKPVSRWPVV